MESERRASDPTRSVIWVAEPVAQSVGYLVDEMMLTVTLRNALITQSGFHMYAALAAEKIEKAGKDTGTAKMLIQHSMHWAQAAKKHVDEKFHTIHVHALINLWAVTLNTFEDTVAACILNDYLCSQGALELIKDRGDHKRHLSEEEATTIAYRLAQGCTKKQGAEVAYPALLKHFDIDFALCNSRDFSELEEARLVRNCFVHRKGVIDKYAADRAPSLAADLGSVPKLDEPRINRYLDSMLHFNQSLMEATTKSRHYPFAPPQG